MSQPSPESPPEPDTEPATEASAKAVLDLLEAAAGALRRLDAGRLVEAWRGAVDEMASIFGSHGGSESAARADEPRADELRASLVAASGLGPAGLDAGMQALLDGVRTPACFDLLRTEARAADRTPGLAILPSNLPGLSPQVILPALAVRRPLLLKMPSRGGDAVFAPALIKALARREPILGRSLATLAWRGGNEEVESLVLPRVGRVVAYGDDGTLRSLGERVGKPRRLVAQGARFSIAVVGAEIAGTESAETAAARADLAHRLAADVSLFDQRGCLSLHALFVVGAASSAVEGLADAITEALAAAAERWPPGDAQAGTLAAVRGLRDEAVMRGLYMGRPELPLRCGTVVVEEAGLRVKPARLEPSPGLRTLRIHRVPDVAGLRRTLEPWAGRLQGAAVGEETARVESGLVPFLREIGVTHVASPGELQRPDIGTWANGGVPPSRLFA